MSLSVPQAASSGELKSNIPLPQTGSPLFESAPQVAPGRYHQEIEADRQHYFPWDLLPNGMPSALTRVYSGVLSLIQKHTHTHSI